MRSNLGLAALVILTTSALTFTGCKSAQTEAPPPEAPQHKAVQPAPAAIPEESVAAPLQTPIPSVESEEQLPENLKELNRRGYLKDAFFDTDSYDLKPEAREVLASDAAWLQKHATVQIMVEGHCDERNTREYNLALGQRRADAVRDYLVFLGVPAANIKTISYGEERPFALGHNEAAWRLNRRAHFVITAR